MLPATPNPNGAPVDRAAYDQVPVPPGIRRALRVFVDHFPELLKKHDGKWVACDGNDILFVGKSWDVLFKRCLNRGLKPDEFIVNFVMPGAIDDLDMEALRRPD